MVWEVYDIGTQRTVGMHRSPQDAMAHMLTDPRRLAYGPSLVMDDDYS